MSRLLVLLLIAVIILAACGGQERQEAVTSEINIISDVVYLGDIAANGVYRFRDDGRTCYLADGREAVAIWCEQ